jgi:hypothetical protein
MDSWADLRGCLGLYPQRAGAYAGDQNRMIVVERTRIVRISYYPPSDGFVKTTFITLAVVEECTVPSEGPYSFGYSTLRSYRQICHPFGFMSYFSLVIRLLLAEV